MAKGLTQRQADIYLFIVAYIEENMFAPTVRDIADRFHLRSTNGVAQHIDALIRKGYLAKEGSKSRTLRPMVSIEDVVVQRDEERQLSKPRRKAKSELAFSIQGNVPALPSQAYSRVSEDGLHRSIPVLGRIAAGTPIHAYEEHEETLSMDAGLFCRGSDDVFALRVRGTSMIGDGIMPGDIVFVRAQERAEDGELVAALVGGEATVKRYERRGKQIRLLPSNPDMEPIVLTPQECEEFRILGSIRGVLRQYA